MQSSHGAHTNLVFLLEEPHPAEQALLAFHVAQFPVLDQVIPGGRFYKLLDLRMKLRK
jgi:hypothetical protein